MLEEPFDVAFVDSWLFLEDLRKVAVVLHECLGKLCGLFRSVHDSLILGIILTVACLVGLYVYNKSYDHQTKFIERDGITVVGEVLEKGRSKHRRGDNTYTIKYKFEYQGENYFGFQEFTDKWYYDNATEGKSYEVKFIKHKDEGLCKNARIYINRPIHSLTN